MKQQTDKGIDYPETKRVIVVDTLHGREIADPYRWLEKENDPKVEEWIEAQNTLTRRFLDEIPFRDKIEKRLEEILSASSVSVPRVKGERYFFTKREGDQNQPVIYYRDGLHGKAKVAVNPNMMSEEGVIAVDWWYPTRDGKLMAVGLSEGGSEQSTLYTINVDTGIEFEESIPRTRAASVAWLPDNSGFYYTRFPEAGEVPPGEEHFHSRVRFHKLGTDPAGDPVVFGEGRDMHDWLSCSISDDGRYLLIHIYKGALQTEIYMKDLYGDADFVPIATGIEAHFWAEVFGEHLFIQTNEDAPNYKIFKAPASNPSRKNWKSIIPERDSKLQFFTMVGRKLILSYLENASSRIYLYNSKGELETEIKLPGIGTVTGTEGEWDGKECFFGFISFFVPHTVYSYDLDTGGIEPYETTDTPIDTSPYKVEQVWYESKDGTRIPMFICRDRDIELNGRVPTVLYGYGGFNVPLTPYFARTTFPWLESGGIFAVANLRGGGEFGEEWHRAGMLENKQNVFDDFIAAAEWLFSNGYTSPEQLAIWGASNGGLLVGAVVAQRPDICRAAVCAVPVLDMLRYHLYSVGRYWMTELGDPDNPDHLEFLMRYSPYHNVKEEIEYPAVILTTAESDSRVDPMHALKMTARIQAATISGRPVLLRYEKKAGHGIGAPLSKTIAEYTDLLSFVFGELGVEVK